MTGFSARTGNIPWVNLILFLVTCFSTSLVGTLLMLGFNNAVSGDLLLEIHDIIRSPTLLVSGLPFSVSIMTILFAHEMGHYLTCLYYGIDVTLPYFIPAPTPMGTMGAFIKIRSQIPHRAALLDVGVAGPIAGFVLAVPTMFIGLAYSRFTVTDATMGGLSFGEPLVFKLAEHMMGKTPPAGMDLYLHPIALAAWFGFLATMLNLLPAGQLDGGHMVYALFPGIHKRISQALVAILVPLGIWYWQGWLLWAVLLVLVIRLRHPMTTYDYLPLERRHILLGWIGLALLILCFMPAPLALIEGS